MSDRAVAFLILAHESPRRLRELIEALNDPDGTFFIHIDAKKDIKPFHAELRASSADVSFLEQREAIRWGDLSLVRAELRLVEQALETSRTFRYLCLLSGCCVPCRPKRAIYDALGACTLEFCDVQDLPLYGARTFDWCGLYHYNFSPVSYARFPRLGRLARRLTRLLPPRPLPGLRGSKGSQWWCLTSSCARSVVERLRAEPWIMERFRWTHAPDELVFQSLVHSGPYRQNVRRLPAARRATTHALHYVSWEAGASHPRELTSADHDAIAQSSALFARKLATPFSDALRKNLLEHPLPLPASWPEHCSALP